MCVCVDIYGYIHTRIYMYIHIWIYKHIHIDNAKGEGGGVILVRSGPHQLAGYIFNEFPSP
jgi:hypothetical protein